MKFEYNTDDYIRKINGSTSYFNTFLDKETLAAGVLVLKPGEEDTQIPHESDVDCVKVLRQGNHAPHPHQNQE